MNLSILFDYQIFFHQEYGGISRYVIELASNLTAFDGTDVEIYGGRHHNAYLQAPPPGVRVVGRKVARGSSKLAHAAGLLGNAASFFVHASKASPTHIHQTYFYELFRPISKATRIVTVYDMTHELFPEQFPAPRRTSHAKRRAVDAADHIICISESTKRDLVRLFDVPSEKASAIPLGLSVRFAELAASGRTLDAIHPRPYVLYVGQRGGYKNFDNFIKAFGTSPRLLRGLDILCFGGGALSTDELDTARRAGLDIARLRQLGGNDDLLAAAYQHAQFLVYPSLYEGFGFPPLEAMALGCAVACSNTSSMPEVVGDTAITFDPRSVDDLARAMTTLADDEAVRHRSRTAGAQRARLFTWQRCAESTRDLYLRTR
jgi:glycosyltransferase involved in cell wall biosynthesis